MYLIYKLRDFIALLVMAVIGIEINNDIPISIIWLQLHAPQAEIKVNIHYSFLNTFKLQTYMYKIICEDF